MGPSIVCDPPCCRRGCGCAPLPQGSDTLFAVTRVGEANIAPVWMMKLIRRERCLQADRGSTAEAEELGRRICVSQRSPAVHRRRMVNPTATTCTAYCGPICSRWWSCCGVWRSVSRETNREPVPQPFPPGRGWLSPCEMNEGAPHVLSAAKTRTRDTVWAPSPSIVARHGDRDGRSLDPTAESSM